MQDSQKVTTTNGRIRLKGTCTKCGTQMSKFIKD